MICSFFKCSLDSDIFLAIHMFYLLLSPASLNSHLGKSQFPDGLQIKKTFLCLQSVPMTVAGLFWHISWGLLFPSAPSLPSSLPCCPHLFQLPASSHCRRHWNCMHLLLFEMLLFILPHQPGGSHQKQLFLNWVCPSWVCADGCTKHQGAEM